MKQFILLGALLFSTCQTSLKKSGSHFIKIRQSLLMMPVK
jgi:hypothetical protein